MIMLGAPAHRADRCRQARPMRTKPKRVRSNRQRGRVGRRLIAAASRRAGSGLRRAMTRPRFAARIPHACSAGQRHPSAAQRHRSRVRAAPMAAIPMGADFQVGWDQDDVVLLLPGLPLRGAFACRYRSYLYRYDTAKPTLNAFRVRIESASASVRIGRPRNRHAETGSKTCSDISISKPSRVKSANPCNTLKQSGHQPPVRFSQRQPVVEPRRACNAHTIVAFAA